MMAIGPLTTCQPSFEAPILKSAPDAFSGQNYWPDKLGRQRLYEPVERGFEREIRKRLEYWARLREERGEA